MPKNPWHRSTCQCPECVDPPGEPTRWNILTLVALMLAAAALMWIP